MQILKTETIPVQTEHDIVAARQATRKLAQECAMSLVDQTKIVTACSELARNAMIYGGGGTMTWEILLDGTKKGLRLRFEDQGPGIPNVEFAMMDGWTSGKGLGMGLSGTKRLVNEFELETAPGKGTRITITRWK